MPDAAHRDAISRQWEMLRLLPRGRPGATAKELAERLGDAGFDVTKRTVERDLQSLSTVFPLACNDKSIPYGWYWMEGREVNLPGMPVADAMSLHIVEDLLRPLLPAAILKGLEPRFRMAREKLEALAGSNRNARWIDKVRHVHPAQPLVPPVIDPAALAGIQQALLEERQVDVHYRRQGEPHARVLRLHPLGLVQRGPVTYLVATAFNYDDARLYALHRVIAVEQTTVPEAVVPPDGFSLDDYIAEGRLQFGDGETLRFEAEVMPWLADILAETPLSQDQKLLPLENGNSLLRAELIDSWQLRWWILSQGEAITIKSPKSLRKWVCDTAGEMVENHCD